MSVKKYFSSLIAQPTYLPLVRDFPAQTPLLYSRLTRVLFYGHFTLLEVLIAQVSLHFLSSILGQIRKFLYGYDPKSHLYNFHYGVISW
jgi:hypothetical protein